MGKKKSASSLCGFVVIVFVGLLLIHILAHYVLLNHILSSFLIFYVMLLLLCSFRYSSTVSLFLLVSFVCFSQLCSFITLLTLDLLYFFLLTLPLFLLILFCSSCFNKSFMLLTFWPFLYQRKRSLAESLLNWGHVEKSKVHFAIPCSFSFLGSVCFPAKHKG